MNKSSIRIKIELNSKIICMKKFMLDEHLDTIREKIKNIIENASFLDKMGNKIKKENEKDISLNDIVNNNVLKLKDLGESDELNIKILLNGQYFFTIKCSENNNLENFRALLYKYKNIQDFVFLREDEIIIDKEDEKDFIIKEILINDTIKIKSNNYKSLQKPLKPIPNNLTKLFVKTYGEALPCFQYPSKQIQGKRYYTLLIIGEIGSGKTTLLDVFVNYLAGINFEDEWRYKLANENHIKDRKGVESQTDEITSYFINYCREDDNSKEINIRIIDTPGIGNYKGVLQDNLIINKLKNLFNEIQELYYILVTVKACTSRYTQQSQYIFDRIQELFGKDAKERFILMCTFSDGQTPPVISVLKNHFIYEDYFCFNNSALYIPSRNADIISKFFWKLGMSNEKRFLDTILEKNLLPLSLRMSIQVLEIREILFINAQNSEIIIKEAYRLLEESHNLLQVIKKYEKQKKETANFTYEIEEERTREVPLPKPYQYCSNCLCLCCQECEWPEGKIFSQCKYFEGGKGCPICPGNCKREAHLKADKIKEKYVVKETRVYEAKKKLFEQSQKGLSVSETALSKTIEKMSELGKLISNNMKLTKNFLMNLDKVALKPTVFLNEEYFKQMIEYEEAQKDYGYENRIKGLKIMKDIAKRINDFSKADNITLLFPQYNEIFKELKNKFPNKQETSCLIF